LERIRVKLLAATSRGYTAKDGKILSLAKT
jgi:hypothetical protein